MRQVNLSSRQKRSWHTGKNTLKAYWMCRVLLQKMCWLAWWTTPKLMNQIAPNHSVSLFCLPLQGTRLSESYSPGSCPEIVWGPPSAGGHHPGALQWNRVPHQNSKWGLEISMVAFRLLQRLGDGLLPRCSKYHELPPFVRLYVS